MKPIQGVKVKKKQVDVPCEPSHATKSAHMDIAMWKIAKECELDHLIPKVKLCIATNLLFLICAFCLNTKTHHSLRMFYFVVLCQYLLLVL